jgi:hypothetical protein
MKRRMMSNSRVFRSAALRPRKNSEVSYVMLAPLHAALQLFEVSVQLPSPCACHRFIDNTTDGRTPPSVDVHHAPFIVCCSPGVRLTVI